MHTTRPGRRWAPGRWPWWLACLCLLGGAGSAGGLNLAPNPSFEQGNGWPQGWTAGPGGQWTSWPARTGTRALGFALPNAGRAWSSAPVALEAGQSYRLSGWLQCRQGTAQLGMDFLDSAGQVVGSAAAPGVAPSPGWQYAAVEAEPPVGAARAQLWLAGAGAGRLDDVILAPMLTNLAYNPACDGDAKDQVGFWADQETGPFPGPRQGSQQADPQGGRTGGALLIAAPGGWWAAHLVDIALPVGISTFRCQGWGRTEGGQAQLWAYWTDAASKILGREQVPAGPGEGPWVCYSSSTLCAPAGATYARLVTMARGGRAWFDDFWFSPAAPARLRQPLVRVHANQVGYALAGPKSLVVATNFFPAGSAAGRLRIVDERGRAALELPLRCSGRIHEGLADDWGWYFWRADFSGLRRAGTWRAVAEVGEARGVSPPFGVGKGLLVQRTARGAVDFFYVQRCGYAVPGWHAACHLDDARLPDGSHLEATGGWHSAGDYNKIMYENGDGGVAFALLEAYRAAPDTFGRYDRDGNRRPDVLEEARWGASFVAKMQTAAGGLLGTISQGPGRAWMKWSPPEVHTDNVVGTSDDPVIDAQPGHSPLVVGAWARLASQGAAGDYLGRAVRLFDHETNQGTAAGSPHLLLSAMELHRVTGETRYLDFCRRSVQAILAAQERQGRHQGAFAGYGEIGAGAIASFALAYPDDALAEQVRKALPTFVSFLVSTADNPFGLTKQAVGEPEYFFEPTSALGRNFEYLYRAWAAAQAYRLVGDRRALRFATDQVDWVLGKNPLGLCMFEGVGVCNPPRYHHRYDSIPGHARGAVPGCIPNGFVRSAYGLDQPGFDLSLVGSPRPHPSYRTSEPWLVHNLWYLMALAALTEAEAGPR